MGVFDALLATRARIEAQPSLAAGLDDLADRFAGKRIITVTSHRRENFGGGMENIAAAVSEIATRPHVAVIFPVHPNPNVRRVIDAAPAAHCNVAMFDPDRESTRLNPMHKCAAS